MLACRLIVGTTIRSAKLERAERPAPSPSVTLLAPRIRGISRSSQPGKVSQNRISNRN